MSGDGIGNFEFVDDILTVDYAMADPRSVTLTPTQLEMFLNAAAEVPWDDLEEDYSFGNPSCCCDLGPITPACEAAVHFCSESLMNELMPDALVAFIETLRNLVDEVETQC